MKFQSQFTFVVAALVLACALAVPAGDMAASSVDTADMGMDKTKEAKKVEGASSMDVPDSSKPGAKPAGVPDSIKTEAKQAAVDQPTGAKQAGVGQPKGAKAAAGKNGKVNDKKKETAKKSKKAQQKGKKSAKVGKDTKNSAKTGKSKKTARVTKKKSKSNSTVAQG